MGSASHHTGHICHAEHAHRIVARPYVPGVRSISTVAGRVLTCRGRDPSPGRSARACPSSVARLRVTHRRACSGRPFPRRGSVTRGDNPPRARNTTPLAKTTSSCRPTQVRCHNMSSCTRRGIPRPGARQGRECHFGKIIQAKPGKKSLRMRLGLTPMSSSVRSKPSTIALGPDR